MGYWLVMARKPQIVLIWLSAALTFAPGFALLQQILPILTGVGIESRHAAGLIGLAGLSSMGGAILSGLLLDRFKPPLLGCIFTLAPAAGCLLLAGGDLSFAGGAVAVLALGLAQGAEIELQAYLIGSYCKIEDYASVFGAGVFISGLLIALFGNLLGFAYDRLGDYRLALLSCAAAFAAASFCYVVLGRYTRRT
jgi:hypothetical protein